MAYAILRTQKLKTTQDIAGAGAHVFRLRETPNADSSVSNYRLDGNKSRTLHQLVNDRIENTGVKTRKNGVLAIEYLLTASPEFFDNCDQSKLEDWAKENYRWLKKQYGSENIVSMVLHMDEKTPHIHAHVVPITRDNRLSARDFIGGDRNRMRDIQTDYAKAMEKFGLERGTEKSIAKHADIKEYYTAVNTAKLKFKPAKLAEPPMLFGRNEYRDKQQKRINKLQKKTAFLGVELNRYQRQSSPREYQKLKEDRDEKAGIIRLMEVAKDNEARRNRDSADSWQERLRAKEEQIEAMNAKAEALRQRAERAEQKNKEMAQELSKYKPVDTPTLGYEKR